MCYRCVEHSRFLQAFLKEYFANQPSIKVEMRSGYLRRKGSRYLYVSDGHSRVVVHNKKGQTIVIDGTASELGPPKPKDPINPIRDFSKPRILDLYDEKRKTTVLELNAELRKRHRERMKRIREAIEAFLDEAEVKEVFQRKQAKDTPLDRVVQLAQALMRYIDPDAKNHRDVEALNKVIQLLYPGQNRIKEPGDISARLIEIHDAQISSLKFHKKNHEGSKRFEAFRDTAVGDRVSALFQTLIDTGWVPFVPLTVPEGNCSGYFEGKTLFFAQYGK